LQASTSRRTSGSRSVSRTSTASGARAQAILGKSQVDPGVRVKDLTEEEAQRIRQIITQEGGVEGDLRKDVTQNIKRLMEIGCYRGVRHRKGLPVRGQRTSTNARTRKGPRRGQVAGKKKIKK
jgi:small subunit ribosomal protein S13